MDDVSNIAQLATTMQQTNLAQQIQMAVLKKAQDAQKQEGEAVISLLNSASVVSANKIDVHV